MFDWFSGEGMLFGGELEFLLLLAWSILVLLFMVVILENISIVFASGGSTGGSCTMLTVLSLQIVIFCLSIIS